MGFEITPLYLVLAAIIGLLIGLLIASIFSGRDSRDRKTDQLPKELKDQGFVKTSSLWYSPAGKKVMTEMDGEYYPDTSKLTTDQKTRILKLQGLWQGWAEQNVVETAAAPVAAVVEPVAEHVWQTGNEPLTDQVQFQSTDTFLEGSTPVQPFSSATEETDAISELQKAFITPEEPELMSEPLETSELPVEIEAVTDFQEIVEPAKEPLEETANQEAENLLGETIIPEPAPRKNLSITEQISEILEEMLVGTDLKEKGIKLIENQQNGVDVWVGLDKYPGIDAVPDPAVKDLIRRAVIQWEEKNASPTRSGN